MQIDKAFSVLKPDMLMDVLPVTSDIYNRLDSDYDRFKSHVLVSSYSFAESWRSWEKHPHGDELVMLMGGAVRIIIQRDAENEIIRLDEVGQYVIVPRDTWHTAQVDGPARLLFITPGEGTLHREINENL